MTLLEFEAWVSDHYEQIRGMTTTVFRYHDALDIVHEIVEEIVRGDKQPPQYLEMGWFYTRVLGCIRNTAQAERAYSKLKARFGDSIDTIGDEDTYLDLTRKLKAANSRREKVRRQAKAGRLPVLLEQQAATHMGPENLFYGQAGDTRWMYQRRRDARLYDAQVCSSLSEHIRGVSSRSLHGAGLSHVHFGLEDPRPRAWGQEVKGYIGANPWTQISCSTGYNYKTRRFGMGSPHHFVRCQGCSEHAISGRHDKACALVKGGAV